MNNPRYNFDKEAAMTISLPVWDKDLNQEVWLTKSLDDWIDDPFNMNVEVFGLHVLNTLRIARKLEPLRHTIKTK